MWLRDPKALYFEALGSITKEASIAGKSHPFEKVELGVLEELVGYHIRRASSLVRADFNASMAETGLRQVLLAILSIISANPGIHQGRVGEVLGIKRGNMVGLVSELEDRGLIRRTMVLGNRRALSLTITPHGRQLLDECLITIHEHENRLLVNLTTDERTLLVMLLDKINSSVRQAF